MFISVTAASLAVAFIHAPKLHSAMYYLYSLMSEFLVRLAYKEWRQALGKSGL